MAPTHLSLLGGFELAGDVAAEAGLTRKARALLAYLALQAGRPQSREKLATLLWSDNGETQARTNLRQALSVIRKAIPAAAGDRFQADSQNVMLNADDVEIDVTRFVRLADGPAPDELEQAIALYRGDLLEGFPLKEEPFEDWLRGERTRLRGIAVRSLERLTAHYAAADNLAGGAIAAARLLALEPSREDIHRALMRIYAAQDRFDLALKQYEICRDALQRELGLGPEPKTAKLYQELRARRLASQEVAPLNGSSAARAPAPDSVNPQRPQTHYVKSGGCNIAYQVSGDGPVDMIYVAGWVSNLDHQWTSPRVAHVFNRLGSFCRLIRCDKRGTGLSDRNVGLPTLEQRMEDVHAVLDAVGSKRTVVFGTSEGGPMCMLFAATYPERTAALVLHGAYARGMWAEDYPWANTQDEINAEITEIERRWGEPVEYSNAAPTLINDIAEREWFASMLRNSASPADAVALWHWGTHIDARDILPAIRVPTLIIHKTRDRWVNVGAGRHLAQHIAGAKYVELDGDDHLLWADHADRVIDEIKAFLANLQALPASERVLLTVLGLKGDGRPRQPRYEDGIGVELRAAGGKYIAEGNGRYLAAFSGPTRAITCAMAIRDRMMRTGHLLRAAIHIGECEVSADGLNGAAIILVSRLLDLAAPGEVVASRTVRDLTAGADLTFDPRCEAKLTDLPGTRSFYIVGSRCELKTPGTSEVTRI